VHDLDDLLAEHFAERSAEHREVLREYADRPTVHGAVPGNHSVAVRPSLGHVEIRRAMPSELVHLDERALVEQHRDAFACSLLAVCVLFLTRGREPRVSRLVDGRWVVLELARGGVDIDLSLLPGHVADRNPATG